MADELALKLAGLWDRHVPDSRDIWNALEFLPEVEEVRAWAQPARELIQAGDRAIDRGIRRYLGPHLGAPVRGLLAVAPEMLPSADVRDMMDFSRKTMESVYAGDPMGAIENAGWMSLAALSTAVPVSTAMFAGPLAKNANMGMLKRAEDMKAGGKSAREIWDETGWFEGADGKWRFEIDDSEVPASPPNYMQTKMLPEAIPHGELIDAYPNYAEMPVVGANMIDEKAAYFRNPYGREGGDIEPGVISINPDHAGDARSLGLHELQHAIQMDEGFAQGGSATSFLKDGYSEEDALASYLRLAGEVEARNVQKRRDYTPEQRRATPPWETEDVPRDRQIVRFGKSLAEALMQRRQY